MTTGNRTAIGAGAIQWQNPTVKKERFQWTMTLIATCSSYATLEDMQPEFGQTADSIDGAPAAADGYIVTDSTLEPNRGGGGKLTATLFLGRAFSEFDAPAVPPPPKPSCKFVRIDLPIDQSDFFKQAMDMLNGCGEPYSTQFMAAEAAVRASTAEARTRSLAILADLSPGSGTGNGNALDYYNKLRRGQDKFIGNYCHASLITYFPNIDDFFSLDEGGYAGTMPNSQIPFPDGMDWLRLGDEVDRGDKFYEQTEQWLGISKGVNDDLGWDADFYPGGNMVGLSLADRAARLQQLADYYARQLRKLKAGR